MCNSTAPLVLDVLRCTSVPPGDLCRVRSAPRAQLLVVEGRAVRSDKGEEEFRSTPLVLAGMIFDRNAMGGFSYLNTSKDKILEVVAMKPRIFFCLCLYQPSGNLNRNNNSKGKMIELNRQQNCGNKTSDEGEWLGKK